MPSSTSLFSPSFWAVVLLLWAPLPPQMHTIHHKAAVARQPRLTAERTDGRTDSDWRGWARQRTPPQDLLCRVYEENLRDTIIVAASRARRLNETTLKYIMLEAGSRNPTLQPGTGTVLLSSPDVAFSFLSTHDWPRRAQSSRYYVRLHKIDRVRPSKLLTLTRPP